MFTRQLVTLFFICCSLSPIFSSPIGPGFSELGAIGRLSADQFSGCGGSQTGAAGCWLNREQTSSTISCQISHNVVNAASIHVGNGTTDYNFFTFPHTSSHFIEGEFMLDRDDDDEQERDFLSGNWYITITSTDCPNGAIGGRLSNNDNVFSLIGSNEVSGRGVGVSNYDHSSMIFRTFIQHDFSSPSKAKLRMRETDDMIFQYEKPETPIDESIFLISYREKELYRRQQRYTIESSDDLAIGGTVKVVDAFPNINYVFSISGTQVPSGMGKSDAFGTGLLSLECDGDLEFIFIHTMSNIQSASVRVGGRGSEEGFTVFPLDILRSPIIGNYHISDALVQELITGNLYVILTDENGLSIRGQILPQYDYYSYLSGSQEVPSLSSLDRGVMLLQLSPGQDSLEYILQTTLPTDADVDAQFFKGDFGYNGPPVYAVDGETVDGVLQDSILVTKTDVNDIRNHWWYINLSTGTHPSGELRGQIVRRSETQCLNQDDSDHQAAWFEDDDFTSEFFGSSSSGASALNHQLITYLICFVCVVLYSANRQ